MSTPIERRGFLALLAASAVVGIALPGLVEATTSVASAAPAGATATSTKVDGVVRLGRMYLRDHPDEADAELLRSQLPGLDATRPVRPQLPDLAPASVDDFRAGRIAFVDGWQLAVTEARASAAVALEV